MLLTKFRFIWPNAFRGEDFFLNRTIRNKNCLWQPCLPMDRDKMSNLYRGPSIDAYYQVAVHLAKGFHRRRLKCEKLTDDRRRTPNLGKSSLCRWQCELNCKVLSRSLCLIWQYIKQYFLFYILEVFLTLRTNYFMCIACIIQSEVVL
jgi:hypothetical protein